MSITRAQQARQLYRFGGDTMGGPNDRSTSGPGPDDRGSAEQNRNQRAQVREGRIRAAENLIDRPTFGLTDAAKFNLTPLPIRVLSGIFSGGTGKVKPPLSQGGGGGGDSQAMVGIPTWMRLGFSSEAEYLASLEKEDEKEDEGLRLAFRADGGRIGLQEGGGIEQRLEKLGGDVTSAEKLLQGINKRLETAESSLGSGGGGLGSIAQPLPGVGPNVGNEIAIPSRPGITSTFTPLPSDPMARPGPDNPLLRPGVAAQPLPFMGRPLFQPLIEGPVRPLPTSLEAVQPLAGPQPAMLEPTVQTPAVAQPLPIQTPPESLPVAQPTIFGYNTGGGLYDAKKDFTSLEDAFEFAQKNAEVLRRGTDFTSAQAPSIDPNTGKFIPFAGELSFDDFSKNFSLQDGALIQNPNTVTGTAGRPIFSTTTDPTFFGIGAEGLTPQQFAFGGSQDPQQAYLDNIAAINANRGGIPAAGYADGGNVVGGEFDFESARQMYGFGKLVKKIGRAVKKVAKSPIGKAALIGAAGFGIPGTSFGGLFGRASFGGAATGLFGKQGIAATLAGLKGTAATKAIGVDKFGNTIYSRAAPSLFSSIPGGGVTAAIAGTSLLAGLLTPKQEEEAEMLAAEKGIDIEKARRSILARAQGNFADDFRATAFRAEGGPAEGKEPVAKKTMPLLDMGGQEMDLRAEGGFVPIGRMEKADDVPARLSKNEFVFTADAVRNAGDGDVDKGAEVMYNMMKNLEAGGEVSEESQGLKGARKMFQTSQRLEEVL